MAVRKIVYFDVFWNLRHRSALNCAADETVTTPLHLDYPRFCNLRSLMSKRCNEFDFNFFVVGFLLSLQTDMAPDSRARSGVTSEGRRPAARRQKGGCVGERRVDPLCGSVANLDCESATGPGLCSNKPFVSPDVRRNDACAMHTNSSHLLLIGRLASLQGSVTSALRWRSLYVSFITKRQIADFEDS
ncbi:hypothetical protein J6590_063762 [Homalodisca vitripennis]|nr:hypothetical protein J6590_063762 [Homalodisca vitripennis]